MVSKETVVISFKTAIKTLLELNEEISEISQP
jgi:hypothetical protein